MLPRSDFLDVTFDLPSEKYWPYRKPNNTPLYIHKDSNHPPVVLKHLQKNIGERLSTISCNKEEFDRSKPMYEQALKNSGFEGKLTYTEPRKKKRRRKPRDILWFNPPFDLNVKTDVVGKFFRILEKHFPEEHRYRKLFNRNTVKASYSCMGNMKSIISGHNSKVIYDTDKPVQKPCNCHNKSNCPLDGDCNAESIIYKATVETPGKPSMIYYGLSEPSFKQRHSNHGTSFRHDKYKNSTELSKYVWSLRDEGISNDEVSINWSIEKRCSEYKCGTRRCSLCISEKTIIAQAEGTNLLNKRSEVVSKCRHRNKFLYSNVQKENVTKVAKVKMKRR